MANRSQREARERRYADANERLDKHESGFSPTTFKPPDGMPVFYWKKTGMFTIDVVPYQIKKQNANPFTSAPKGDYYWERTFYDHANVGPNNRRYTCLSRTFDKPCPICERREQLKQRPDANEEVIKSLLSKERQLMLFYVHEERDKGLQVYEGSYKLGFGELLQTKLAAAKMRNPKHRNLGFWHDQGGMTLEVMVVEDKWQGRTTKKPKDIAFVPREEEIPQEILDAAPCLDELLVETPYEKLKSIFLVRPADNKTEDDEDSAKTRKRPKHEANGDDSDDKEGNDDNDQDDQADDEDEDADDSVDDDANDDQDQDDNDSDSDDADADADEDEDTDDGAESGGDDADDDEPQPPPKKGAKVTKPTTIGKSKKADPKASEFGIKLKSRVKHKDYGVCTVVHVSSDETSLRIEDSEGEVFSMIGPDEVALVKPKPKAK